MYKPNLVDVVSMLMERNEHGDNTPIEFKKNFFSKVKLYPNEYPGNYADGDDLDFYLDKAYKTVYGMTYREFWFSESQKTAQKARSKLTHLSLNIKQAYRYIKQKIGIEK